MAVVGKGQSQGGHAVQTDAPAARACGAASAAQLIGKGERCAAAAPIPCAVQGPDLDTGQRDLPAGAKLVGPARLSTSPASLAAAIAGVIGI